MYDIPIIFSVVASQIP